MSQHEALVAPVPIASEKFPAADQQTLALENARLRARIAELEQRRNADTRDMLDQFAESSSGWFWEMDADLRFTWFSASVESVTGVKPEWHYGKTREELGAHQGVPDEQWREHREVLERREPFKGFLFRRTGPDGVRWLRTSGTPVVDRDGRFLGYRGTAIDVTAETVARRTANRLLDAVEDLNDLFVLWDADDRLIMCNQRFRELNARIVHTLQPGVSFEEHIRAGLAEGLFPQAVGREDEWFEERLARHRSPGAPLEQERQDGRWLLVREHRLEDGSTTTICTDITARRRTEQEVRNQNQLLATALQTIPDGVQVLDADLNLVTWNERLWEVLELDGEAILASDDPGKAFRYTLARRGEYGEGDLDELVASREAIARTPKAVFYERQLVSGRWIECRGSPVPGGGYLAVYRDVDEQKRMQDELERLATRDELTGLSNRRSLLMFLTNEMERFERYGRDLTLLYIDVDHFKHINDRFGHGVGDRVLEGLSELLLQSFRDVDCVGRIGGEEFAVVLAECGLEQGRFVAERLRESVGAMAIHSDEVAVKVSVSIGVARMRRSLTLTGFMNEADAALYRAKHAGRNRVIVHDDP